VTIQFRSSKPSVLLIRRLGRQNPLIAPFIEVLGDMSTTGKKYAGKPASKVNSTGKDQRKNVSESKVCFAYQKGTCSRGDSCRFSHSGPAASRPRDTAASKTSTKTPVVAPTNENKSVDKPTNVPEGIVLFGNEPIPVPTTGRPTKKPKHLKRKLEVAEKTGDQQLLEELQSEANSLKEIKDDAAKKFKKTCRRLVIKLHGDDAWENCDFDELISSGCRGNKLLKKLHISHEEQQKFEEEGPKKRKKGGDQSGSESESESESEPESVSETE
jgi:hypothetical protein